MSRSATNPWLNRFAILTALATLALIGIGGLVTSHGVGMAVPDWPTTYGYNMFAFPISKWVGGVFYEHSHRLVASAVGFLTVILMVWLWIKDSRRWLRWLGVAAFFAVVLQGVLGGLRVVLYKDEIGIFHAALAQAFLVLTCAIALFTSAWWNKLSERIAPIIDNAGLRRLFAIVTVLIFVQLVVGATMRHQHAGLAIPDFPLAYHKIWPPMDAASVATYNQTRDAAEGTNPITAFQIGLQMLHRIMALLIGIAVVYSAWLTRRQLGVRNPLAKLSLVWVGLILLQVTLGAYTIWSNKAADIATVHVMVGALSLVTATLLTIVSFRLLIPVRAANLAAAKSETTEFLPDKRAATSVK
ncbi:MAG: Cytochrome oxidase assembly [Pedosphaera sp.]|nr:Cytochrome oxidase assembly [Pedosphaera sp.]